MVAFEKQHRKNPPPKRKPNSELRPREYLTLDEVNKLLTAAKNSGKHSHRDYCIVLMGFRHGLRASELVGMKWQDVNLDEGTVYIRRAKGSISGVHPLQGDEKRALRRLQREYPDSPWLFESQCGGNISVENLRRIIAHLGRLAGFSWRVHPHQLRHACGAALISKTDVRVVQVWLGHRCIQNTVSYTALDQSRFKGLWDS